MPPDIHDQIAHDTTHLGGFLRCESCQRIQTLTKTDTASHLRTGWPRCCGYTMRWWTQHQVNAGEHHQ